MTRIFHYGSDFTLINPSDILFHRTQSQYPFYNIVNTGEDTWDFEFALAGFKRDEITVSFEKGILIVQAEKEDSQVERVYEHQGIATRSFERQFKLIEYANIHSAEFVDGILTIKIVRNVPKECQRQTFKIS
jgi:molecular chaperone IbpA